MQRNVELTDGDFFAIKHFLCPVYVGTFNGIQEQMIKQEGIKGCVFKAILIEDDMCCAELVFPTFERYFGFRNTASTETDESKIGQLLNGDVSIKKIDQKEKKLMFSFDISHCVISTVSKGYVENLLRSTV